MTEQVKDLFEFAEKPMTLPKGSKLKLELEALGDGEQCDNILALDYFDFGNEQSLSGVFRVLSISSQRTSEV